MRNSSHSLRLMSFRVVTAVLFAIAILSGHAASDPDEAEQRAYVLDIQKVRKLAAAYETTRKALATNKSLNGELNKMEDEPDKTLADLRARIRRHPNLFGSALKNGLSENDVVLIPLVLLSASVNIQANGGKPLSPEVSATHIAFLKQYMGELESLRLFEGFGK